MSIVLKPDASDAQLDQVVHKIESAGLKADISSGEFQTVIGVIGDEKKLDFDQIKMMPGVLDAIRIQVPYRLVSRSYIRRDVVVKVRGVSIGGDNPPVYMCGPCSIESYEQIHRIGRQVRDAGAHILRGGAYKPRTSVHSFQGLGLEGLKHLQAAGKDLDLPTITEVRSEADVEKVAKYADILQIGARNMFNQDLIEMAARAGKPILFKRSFAAQIDEYLSFAERIVANKNRNIILCERGITPLGGTFKPQTRFTLDLNAVPVLRRETPFPVIADPSHGTGRRELVAPMSRASIAAGAHGLMIEVHDRPQEALSDGAQALQPGQLAGIIRTCNTLYQTISEGETPFAGDLPFANGKG
ncbi:MAG TPA: 3-deoxy-7-phosphoheptulonate synthase [Nitrososphaerales archaeon]|nr:3-deoxy-7-phosphoheptulonate synthase [Nitrososphaerales archaeon]